jgi:hypothetical protein
MAEEAKQGSDQRREQRPPAGQKAATAGRPEEAPSAEASAKQVRERAREWARKYAAESRRRIDNAAAERVREIEQLTEKITAHARALAEESNELAALAKKQFEVPVPPQRDGAPADRNRRFAPGAKGVPEDVRLLATQMAVAGSSREEIEQRLRKDLGVKDSSAVLERIGI